MKYAALAIALPLGWVAAMLLAVAAAGAAFAAGPIPTEETGFTEYMAKAFQQALPTSKVRVVEPLSLSIESSPGNLSRVNLNGVFSVCRRNPPACGEQAAAFLKQLSAFAAQPVPTLSRAGLRSVLRRNDYVRGLEQELAEPAHRVMVTRPFLGELQVVCYFDMPTVMRPLMLDDVEKLGLTAAQALATGTNNVRDALPPLAEVVKPLGERAIGILNSDPYESSRLLLHDDWKPVAQELGGRLLVAAPAADMVLYAKEVDADAVGALSALAHRMAQAAPRPLTPMVFRWTPRGWEVAAP